MKYYAVPMEGITGFMFRNAHHRYLSGVDKYYSPFITPNQNRSFGPRERRGILSKNDEGVRLVPQILTSRSEDFVKAALGMKALGHEEASLNLGCPFKTVVTKGHGSGSPTEREKLYQLLGEIYTGLDMKISVKTRTDRGSEEGQPEPLELYNRFPAEELTVHPRIQQDYYKNVSERGVFGGVPEGSRSLVCCNGNIFTVGDFEKPTAAFPEAEAVMLGHGLITNPWLAGMLAEASGEEGRTNEEADVVESRVEAACKERLQVLHDEIYAGYGGYLSGDRDVLFRIRESWSYLSCLFEHSEPYLKEIRKPGYGGGYWTVVGSLFLEQSLIMRAGFKP